VAAVFFDALCRHSRVFQAVFLSRKPKEYSTMDPQNNYPPENPNEIKTRLLFFAAVIAVMLIVKFVIGM